MVFVSVHVFINHFLFSPQLSSVSTKKSTLVHALLFLLISLQPDIADPYPCPLSSFSGPQGTDLAFFLLLPYFLHFSAIFSPPAKIRHEPLPLMDTVDSVHWTWASLNWSIIWSNMPSVLCHLCCYLFLEPPASALLSLGSPGKPSSPSQAIWLGGGQASRSPNGDYHDGDGDGDGDHESQCQNWFNNNTTT